MRTTVVLDQRLLRQAKKCAASRGMTLSALVAEALRARLAPAPKPAVRFEMITFGGSKRKARHEPADFARALEDEDRASLAR